MPKSDRQKMKLLYLSEIFKRETDENHPISIKEISDKLRLYDIESERKSLYTDMEALRLFGMDIEKIGGASNTKYYLGTREFELPELQLLADSVACSKFITQKKSKELIKKIEKLTSIYQERVLDRNVIVANRVKAINEKIYYNIQTIHEAIEKKVKITFLYFDYGMDKKKHYRRDKQTYTFSPYSLAWDNENYYCVGYHEARKGVANFRVDCMESIRLTDIPIKASERFSITDYNKRVFGMFIGEKVRANLVFHKSLARAVMDKFGNDVRMHVLNDEEFYITVDVSKSPTFLAWIFQFGEKARIDSPSELVEYMKKQIKVINANLKKSGSIN